MNCMETLNQRIDAIINADNTDDRIRLIGEYNKYLKKIAKPGTERHNEGLALLSSRLSESMMSENLDFIIKSMNLTFIAREYFGRTQSWLSQRINGNLVNGKPASFTKEERLKLQAALYEIAERVKQVADRI